MVAGIADQVLVMQNGNAMEQAAARIFSAPQFEYTRKLLAAIPRGAKPMPASLEAAAAAAGKSPHHEVPVAARGRAEVIAVDDVGLTPAR